MPWSSTARADERLLVRTPESRSNGGVMLKALPPNRYKTCPNDCA